MVKTCYNGTVNQTKHIMTTNITDAIKTAYRLVAMTDADIKAAYSRDELRKIRTLLATKSPSESYDDIKEAVQAAAAEIVGAVAEAQKLRTLGIKVDVAPLDERVQVVKDAISDLAVDSNDDVTIPKLAGEWVAVEQASYAPNSQLAHFTELKKQLTAWAESGNSQLDKRRVARYLATVNGTLTSARDAKKDLYGEKLNSRQSDQKMPDSELMVWAVKKVAEAAKQTEPLSKAGEIAELAIALMLVTGRRPAEVLSQASSFTALQGNMISFQGRAKTKGADGGIDAVIEFKVPGKASDVERAVMLLEKSDARVALHKQVNRKYNTNLKRAITRLTGNEAAVPYDCRKLFVSYSLARFKKADGTDRNVFLSSILGHSGRDKVSQNSYLDFQNEGDIWSKEALAL